MSFSYSLGAVPAIDIPRMLVGDTVDTGHIFEDEEISTFSTIASTVYMSGPGGTRTVSAHLSYLRTAAMMCDALAALKSRMDLTRLQDANTDFHGSAKELREQAARFRQIDDESGAFAIIEQCFTDFARRDRIYNQWQRGVGV